MNVRVDTFEVFLPGSKQPVTLEAYTAYIKGRMAADETSDVKSPDLPAVYDYSPPILRGNHIHNQET
jgi:hypothetical protein